MRSRGLAVTGRTGRNEVDTTRQKDLLRAEIVPNIPSEVSAGRRRNRVTPGHGPGSTKFPGGGNG